jgi:hypothetical protein
MHNSRTVTSSKKTHGQQAFQRLEHALILSPIEISIHFTVVEPGRRFTNLKDFHELFVGKSFKLYNWR